MGRGNGSTGSEYGTIVRALSNRYFMLTATPSLSIAAWIGYAVREGVDNDAHLNVTLAGRMAQGQIAGVWSARVPL